MTRRNLIVLLIFVVIAGAIAGAFVFLSQMGASGPSAMPGVYHSPSGAATQQEMTQYEVIPETNGTGTNLGACV